MKVAYFFINQGVNGLYRLINILDSLESGKNTLEIIALCFFDENVEVLVSNNELSKRLYIAATANGIMLFKSSVVDLNNRRDNSQVAVLQDGVHSYRKPTQEVFVSVENGEEVSCFPDFYSAINAKDDVRIISV